jgi:hypothetical protein
MFHKEASASKTCTNKGFINTRRIWRGLNTNYIYIKSEYVEALSYLYKTNIILTECIPTCRTLPVADL